MSTVLVTGASRGIGRETVIRLAAAGHDVFAGVRRMEDAEPLAHTPGGRVTPVILDVANADHLAALADALPSRLDAVVNNAGIVVGGPLEALPLDDLRHQLEVNLVGQIGVTQAVAPKLRESRGRVVFVSSVSGRIVTPMMGAYNASKFALEAVADALRLELSPWRIRVIVVQPAQTDTDLWRTADQELDRSVESLSPTHRQLYAGHIEGMRRMIPQSQRAAVPVGDVADTIVRAVTTRRPRARYAVGVAPRVALAAAKVLPTPVLDAALRKQTGIPSPR